MIPVPAWFPRPREITVDFTGAVAKRYGFMNHIRIIKRLHHDRRRNLLGQCIAVQNAESGGSSCRHNKIAAIDGLSYCRLHNSLLIVADRIEHAPRSSSQRSLLEIEPTGSVINRQYRSTSPRVAAGP